MDHRYQIYGLQVRSTEPLGGLWSGKPGIAPDLDVIWCRDEGDQLIESRQWLALTMPLPQNSVPPVTLWRSDSAGGDLLRLRYSIDGFDCDFVFGQQEQKLWVFFPGEITRGKLRPFLFGSVMSSLLRLRGTICLHASVVSLEDKAIAFAGRKGAGKSTTVAALAQRGAALLTDDIAAINVERERFVVHPGAMDIRLLQSSVGALYGTEGSVSQPGIDGKVRVRLSADAGPFGRFASRAMPLAAVYLFADDLSSGTQPSISMVPPRERYMALFQHLYGFWLDKDLTHGADFKKLSLLANSVPVYRIHRRRELDELPMMCDAVIENLSQQDQRDVLQEVSVS